MVVGSAAKGPDAMELRSSPRTSEMTKQRHFAGLIASARWPPLMRERCFRTVLISWMLAPDLRRRLVRRVFSARGIIGNGISAEPPPDISAITRSSFVAFWLIFRMRFAPLTPVSLGRG